ncbi:serine hydrolase domain-containing protein [Plantibacter sp. CFBP 8775]|uniref:serine hydrolase domain-containing protein n=1 Tax=Plantibacter sp. CFBP 8775 TaxID=2774038 RepID=UPI0017823C14|nr:serine hydrolase domain-containing protein [Plantibacter sp. CFBP 8775]MBD8101369.1 beta-lactamase family protein [Plantibacter sp. CFBP 8775]
MNDQTQTHTQTKTQHQTRHRTIIAVSAAAALLAGTVSLSACSSATEQTAGSESGPLQDRMQSLVDAGYPAALASVIGPDGEAIDVAAGIGDLATDEPAPVDGEVRIASNTKMFVSTVVLQLVQEGKVALDAPIDTYLPGLITGDGIDGTRISVRQLLQHTAGLPEYADQIAADAFAAQERYISPRDMLEIALAKPAVFAPGERWAYSNTNYLVLGLMVEHVTDRALAQQIDERIVKPLDLEHTYFPAPGELELRGEHPHGYHAKTVGDLLDITALDTSFAWSAGALVSTPHELNVFMKALLDGELLEKETLAEMQTTVPAGDELWPGAGYGLGLQSYPLSCGGVAWGHGGDIPGTQTRNAVGPDGTAVTIAVTSLPWAVVSPDDNERLMQQYRIVVDALDATLCER